VILDDSEFESFVFCLAQKRICNNLQKDHQDLVSFIIHLRVLMIKVICTREDHCVFSILISIHSRLSRIIIKVFFFCFAMILRALCQLFAFKFTLYVYHYTGFTKCVLEPVCSFSLQVLYCRSRDQVMACSGRLENFCLHTSFMMTDSNMVRYCTHNYVSTNARFYSAGSLSAIGIVAHVIWAEASFMNFAYIQAVQLLIYMSLFRQEFVIASSSFMSCIYNLRVLFTECLLDYMLYMNLLV
jgi:hypothetical protein